MRLQFSVGLLALVAMTPIHAAPASVGALLQATPAPPVTATVAGQWQSNLKIVAPAFTGFEAKLAAERQAIERAVAKAGASSMPSDMARPASDPTYAGQLQKKLQSMTPEQQMAFAMQMQGQMQQDGLAAVQDPAPVQAAVEAYNAYVADARQSPPAAALAQRTDAIRQRFDAQQKQIAKKLRYCDVGCTDDAGTEANNRQAWAQMHAIADEELKAWAALFRQWQAERAPVVARGERELAATQYGTLSKSSANRSVIHLYHSAMLAEVEMLLSITREATERAAAVDRGMKANAAAGVTY